MRTRDAALWLALLPIAATVAQFWPRPARLCAAPYGAEVRLACQDGASAVEGPTRLLFGGRLDANLASAGDLELLPGIGPGRAAAIVRERARGPYQSLANLEHRVRGIGPATLRRVEGGLEVGPQRQSDAPVADPEATPHP